MRMIMLICGSVLLLTCTAFFVYEFVNYHDILRTELSTVGKITASHITPSLAFDDKEDAEDYRYFPEPDLTPFDLTDDFIASVKDSLPVLQKERIKKYTSSYQLSEYDATALTEEKDFSDYFEQLVLSNGDKIDIKPKSAANWMLHFSKTSDH